MFARNTSLIWLFCKNGFVGGLVRRANVPNKLKRALEAQTDYNVLVTILTDGEENSSQEYSRSNIKNLLFQHIVHREQR